MSKWDKMDKICWDNSEVISEFEKLVAKATIVLRNKVEAQQASEISNKLNQINKDVQSASQGMESFLDKAKNLAKDEEPYQEEEFIEPTEDEQAIAKAKLLDELNQLAATAIQEKNYKLAYKIERSIDSILFEG